MPRSTIQMWSSVLAFTAYELADSGVSQASSPPPDADPGAGPQAGGLAHGAAPSTPGARDRAKAEALSPAVLPHGRMGLPFGSAGHRDPLLSRGSRAGPHREGDERSREPARDHDVPAPRGRPRVQ